MSVPRGDQEHSSKLRDLTASERKEGSSGVTLHPLLHFLFSSEYNPVKHVIKLDTCNSLEACFKFH